MSALDIGAPERTLVKGLSSGPHPGTPAPSVVDSRRHDHEQRPETRIETAEASSPVGGRWRIRRTG